MKRRAMVAGRPLKIGVLNDMSGVFADHQNKPDVGMAIARMWLDTEGVDAITDLPNSSIALAVAGLVTERNKVFKAVAGGADPGDGRAVVALAAAQDGLP